MGLYDVTNCEWAREKGQTTILEQRGLELTILYVLNYCQEETEKSVEEIYKHRNYEIVDSLCVYRDGEIHVLDGYENVIEVPTPEFGLLYLSYAYKCASGQAILVFYNSLDDACNHTNRILVSL